MRHAKYEVMEDNRFFASIAECPGAWSDGDTLQLCREELQSVLEEWAVFRVSRSLNVSSVEGIGPALVRIGRTPVADGEHLFMQKDDRTFRIPNPNGKDIEWSLMKRILQQGNIDPQQWEEIEQN